jgi:hypothetical protein
MLASLSLEGHVGFTNTLCAILDLTHNLAALGMSVKFNLPI